MGKEKQAIRVIPVLHAGSNNKMGYLPSREEDIDLAHIQYPPADRYVVQQRSIPECNDRFELKRPPEIHIIWMRGLEDRL